MTQVKFRTFFYMTDRSKYYFDGPETHKERRLSEVEGQLTELDGNQAGAYSKLCHET